MLLRRSVLMGFAVLYPSYEYLSDAPTLRGLIPADG